MERVTSQHGFDLAALRETELHPEHERAWEKRRAGLKAVHATTNALVDQIHAHEARLAEIERRLAERPF